MCLVNHNRSPVPEVRETLPESKMRTGILRAPTPHLFASADSKRLAGEFFVSADSKGVITPLFPADPTGACKCGL